MGVDFKFIKRPTRDSNEYRRESVRGENVQKGRGRTSDGPTLFSAILYGGFFELMARNYPLHHI